MSLRLTDITVSVPDGPDVLTILDHLSLDVAPGEVVAVVGASGSGKSTMLAVAGLLRTPTSGSVRIGDVEAASQSAAQRTSLRRDRIGLVFQSSNLFPSLTALEQLELVAHLAGRLDGAARARAHELLDAVGLGNRTHHRPAQLSGGERQRVGIARALMNRPAVLLADEPTASLDDARGRSVMELLVSQAYEHGVAALVITHSIEQIPRASRWLELRDGALRPMTSRT